MIPTVPLLSQAMVTLSRAQLGEDLLNIAIGMLLLFVAIAAIALFFLRRKTRDLTLVYFGIFVTLYAIRLIVPQLTLRALFGYSESFSGQVTWIITCTIILPFGLFVYQIVGPQMKSFLRWMLSIQAVFAVVGISAAVAGVRIDQLTLVNNTFVLAIIIATGVFLLVSRSRQKTRKPLTREIRILIGSFLIWLAFILHSNLSGLHLLPGRNVEVLGFLVFVGGLGYVAAHRTFANEERLLELHKELEIARQIQSATLPRAVPKLLGLEVAARYVPMSAVAGDFYDFLYDGENRLGILIADVSGHGVPAALIASMVKVAFAGQSQHIADPVRVLTGLNLALCGKFEDHYVTAAYVFIDIKNGTMRYAGAAHPPLMLASRSPSSVRRIEENGTMLGLFPEAPYTATQIPLRPGDRVLLYTDGVFEAMSPTLEEYGKPRVEKFLSAQADLSTNAFASALLDDVNRWSEDPNGRSQDDDITLVVLDFQSGKQAET
jgi:phosphoserine phosphatase RsbU/P